MSERAPDIVFTGGCVVAIARSGTNPSELILWSPPSRDNPGMTTLYLQMGEKLSEHWKAHGNAYPQKFVLSPPLRDEYLKNLSWLAENRGIAPPLPEKHMGVRIEVDEASPGVMVAIDGSEVPLQ